MRNLLLPRDKFDLREILSQANAHKQRVEVFGEHSKQRMGRPIKVDQFLSTRRISGISLYSPKELVISVRAGTLLSTVEEALHSENQMLAFEPIDYGPMLGMEPGRGSIGAVYACNLSGSRRIRAGAARDALIGFEAVNGRGETFMSGGRVMKNVTGYDLCKGLAGSWGTLCVYGSLTMKVIPRYETSCTLILTGLDDPLAINALCDAMTSPFEVTGAAHLQIEPASRLSNPSLASLGKSVTAIRLENFSTAVSVRGARLRNQLSCYGEVIDLGEQETDEFWRDLRQLKFLAGSRTPVWRISTSPQNGPKLVNALQRVVDVSAVYDWSGGLVWLEVPDTSDVSGTDIRRVLESLGGHATLVRAPEDVRIRTDVFQPTPGVYGRLTRGLKNNFDPNRILNPERMYAGL